MARRAGATPGRGFALPMVIMNTRQTLKPIACSVGIMAHNEGENIGRLLQSLADQQLFSVAVSEIIVIASGCSDSTEAVVRHWAANDLRIRILLQPRREGKASAVNLFLSEAQERLLVLCSADLVLAQDTIEQLVSPFTDREIGITTCRPVPLNDRNEFMGFAAHLLWDLHHQINLQDFKCGEVIAFRKSFERIPYRTPTDEASIEPVIRGQGYQTKYVPTAIVYNKGPENIGDFVRQRRRIYAGHLAIRRAIGYSVTTMGKFRLVNLALKNCSRKPRHLSWMCQVALLEAYCRWLGWRDFVKRRDHGSWDIAESTKNLGPLMAQAARAANSGQSSDGKGR